MLAVLAPAVKYGTGLPSFVAARTRRGCMTSMATTPPRLGPTPLAEVQVSLEGRQGVEPEKMPELVVRREGREVDPGAEDSLTA